MKEKRPQPTAVLKRRLRRVSHHLDKMLATDWAGTSDAVQWKARANTCWQAAARLELYIDDATPPCEGCTKLATTEDDVGVPLCDDCYAALDRSA